MGIDHHQDSFHRAAAQGFVVVLVVMSIPLEPLRPQLSSIRRHSRQMTTKHIRALELAVTPAAGRKIMNMDVCKGDRRRRRSCQNKSSSSSREWSELLRINLLVEQWQQHQGQQQRHHHHRCSIRGTKERGTEYAACGTRTLWCPLSNGNEDAPKVISCSCSAGDVINIFWWWGLNALHAKINWGDMDCTNKPLILIYNNMERIVFSFITVIYFDWIIVGDQENLFSSESQWSCGLNWCDEFNSPFSAVNYPNSISILAHLSPFRWPL